LKEITEADVPGVWVHTPGGEENSREITLLPNGKIDDPAGRNAWTFEGKTLVLRWADRRAPGGFWIDTCTVAWGPMGKRLDYRGVNQRKMPIGGYKGKLPPGFEKWRQELRASIEHRNAANAELRARRAWEELHWAELHGNDPSPFGPNVPWKDAQTPYRNPLKRNANGTYND
jgi:hypothetical protein